MREHPVRILYEDNHLVAAYKKPGQTVQPEPGKPESLEEQVKQYIKTTYDKPGDVFLGVIHRIDMPVSGIVLFAKTSKALARMNEIFQKREVSKIYEAEVEGHPEKQQELITHFLKRDEKKNYTKAFVSEAKDAYRSQLEYIVTERKKQSSILRITLLTGRKHQIRAQLSAIGFPIVGDVKYGASKPLPDQSIRLSAVELSFMHPVKKEPVVIRLSQHKY